MAFRTDFARSGSARRTVKRSSSTPSRVVPRLEGLEDRVVPYAASGNFWPDPHSTARTAFDLFESRKAIETGPVPASASTDTSTPNSSPTVSAAAVPITGRKPSIAVEREESADVGSRPLGFLSLLAVALGPNPPVSADPRRRPQVRS